MIQKFFKKEYSEKEWENVINKALEFGCRLEYSIYGSICYIDSTKLEDRLLESTHRDLSDCAARLEWAEHIFRRIEEASNGI